MLRTILVSLLVLALPGCGSDPSPDGVPVADVPSGVDIAGSDAVEGPADVPVVGEDIAAGPTDTPAPIDDAPPATPDAPQPEDMKSRVEVVLASPAIATFCADRCQTIEQKCDLEQVGGSVSACAAECEVQLTTASAWGISYECFSQSCDYQGCFPAGDPLPFLEPCESVCEKLDGCDQLEVLELPEDEPLICVVACSGMIASTPTAAIFQCLDQTLETDCSAAAVETCFAAASAEGCAELCNGLFDSSSEDYCPPGSGLRTDWSGGAQCEAACAGLSTAQQLIMSGCLVANDCGPVATCTSPPPASAPACVEACAAGIELCGMLGSYSTAEPCGAFCTGLLLAGGISDTADGAGACVTAKNKCLDGKGTFSPILECVVPISATCEASCGAIVPCLGPGEDFNCDFVCSVLESTAPTEATAFHGCVSAAGANCAAMEGCIPEDGEGP